MAMGYVGPPLLVDVYVSPILSKGVEILLLDKRHRSSSFVSGKPLPDCFRLGAQPSSSGLYTCCLLSILFVKDLLFDPCCTLVFVLCFGRIVGTLSIPCIPFEVGLYVVEMMVPVGVVVVPHLLVSAPESPQPCTPG